MALKILMLRRSIDLKQKELAELRKQDAAFATREEELEAAISEATTEEDRLAVEQLVAEYEAEIAAHKAAVAELEAKITELKGEMDALEEEHPDRPEPERDPATSVEINIERNDLRMASINIRALPRNQRVFDALPMAQRTSILAQDDSKQFLATLRSMHSQRRDITGGELTIPVTYLELIAENMYRYSKLLNRVRIRNVSGQARQTIAGTVPEAVWTEMCAAINELTFAFNQITVDGYKVAGFIPVCNSLLEDNDINLAGSLIEMLSEAIGLAVDKAILYGKGVGMPLGIVTRLAQAQAPANYPAAAPAWVDLHTTNIQQIGGDNVTGAAFWAALVEATGNTFTRYSRGEQFWAMNSKTYAKLKSKLITFTATGDIVANIFGVLPIINGDVDILEFMPDGDIVGGYGDLYLVAMRSGLTIEQSREVQFIQDNTVFRAKQRLDGTPIIPGAFVAVNINNTAVTTVMDFAADTANDADLDSITGLTLTPAFDPDTTTYTASMSAAGAVLATPVQADAAIALSYNGKNIVNGNTLTPATGTNPLTITVSKGNAVKVYTVSITKS